MSAAFAAVDLGASAGRVMLGHVDGDNLRLAEISRFANQPVEVGGTLHWNVLGLYGAIIDGLRSVAAQTMHDAALTSIGIDSWAVDYALLDGTGSLLGNPVHYRDRRTNGVMDKVLAMIPASRLYATTGIQLMPINSVFQLAAAANTPQLNAARTLLLVPDLIGYWLTGTAKAELTNASTTQLLDIRTGDWAWDLIEQLGIDLALFPPIQQPGDLVGPLLRDVTEATGLAADVSVVAVGSHDTASAVAAVPAETANFAYISSGTWSLVGVELDHPVLTAASQAANFTNELGIDDTVRFLRNVMGLWLLQECVRCWQAEGHSVELAALLHDAARVKSLTAVVNAGDAAFLPPGDMPERIANACRRTGQAPPASPAQFVRCILDSLALAYRRAILDAMRLSGRTVEVVHIVGGGAHNDLLCQLTADACALPVIAGPAEASALGNVLVQARTAGVIPDDLAEMRRLLRRTQPVRHYAPRGGAADWEAAERRLLS